MAGNSRQESCGYGITGTGYVEDFLRRRRVVPHLAVPADDGDALFRAGHHEVGELILLMQDFRCRYDGLSFIGYRPSQAVAQFFHVRRHEIGAVVFRPIAALGVDQDGNPGPIGFFDDALSQGIGEDAFLIVRQDDTVQAGCHAVVQPGHELFLFRNGQGRHFFKIQAYHLLAGAEDAHFRRRRVVLAHDQARPVDMGVFQQLVQERRVFIVADEAAQKDVTIEIGQVRGYVGSPAQDGRHVVDFIDRYGRFRRNAFHFTEHIAVDHDVADDGDAQFRQDMVQKMIDIIFCHNVPRFRSLISFLSCP